MTPNELEGLRNAHLVQPVWIRQAGGVVIEPRTVARLPFCAADDAELGHASTSHVIAAFFLLDEGAAAVASLPAFLFRLFDQFGNFGIFRTLARSMHLVVAKNAYLGLTSWAEGVFTALNCVDV